MNDEKYAMFFRADILYTSNWVTEIQYLSKNKI